MTARPHDVRDPDRVARTPLERERWWPYRACAPDPDQPTRSAADPTVPLTAWWTRDREPQILRTAREQQAKTLCHGCPILAVCRAYALGDLPGWDAQPDDVWGGMTARERRDHLAARSGHHRAAPTVTISPLDQVVLVALATHRTPDAVAAAAHMPAHRAAWHRSRLVTTLGLNPATATRGQLLDTAAHHHLLPAGTRIVPDVALTAAIPSRQADLHRHTTTQTGTRGPTDTSNGHTTPTTTAATRAARTPTTPPRRGRRPPATARRTTDTRTQPRHEQLEMVA